MHLDNPDRQEAESAFGCEVKICKACHEWLPADEEFFYREVRNKDGLNAWCKACWADYRDKRTERERAAKQDAGMLARSRVNL